MTRAARSVPILAAVALLHVLASAPAHAQAVPTDERDDHERRLDVALGGGTSWSSDWSDLVVLGTQGGLVERVLLRDLSVAPGLIGDATVTYWEDRYGFRVHGGYSPSCISVGAGCDVVRLGLPTEPDLEPLTGEVDVDSWFLDVGGVVSLVEPRPDQWIRPFVVGGFGIVTYDLDDAVRTLLPTFVALGGSRGLLALADTIDTVVVLADDPFLFSVDEPDLETQFAWVLGLGTDLHVSLGTDAVAVRLEFTDHVTKSPLDVRLAGFDGDIFDDDGRASEIEFDFGWVHNLRFAAGLVLEFGLD